MKGLRKYLTPFAPDQSGAVSVLYELGGILIICDAGGCVGNICGFDEPRWLQKKSAIFSAGLRDMDAIMGRDELLVKKLVMAAEEIDAKFVALIGTPVPSVIGTDYHALTRMAERKLKLPVLAIDTNGMELSDVGASKAYLELARRFVGTQAEKPKANSEEAEQRTCLNESTNKAMAKGRTLGIWGCNPLELSDLKAAEKLKAYYKEKGYDQVYVYGMDGSLEDFKYASSVEKNIVVSPCGLAVAEYMQKNFGIPFEVVNVLAEEFITKNLALISVSEMKCEQEENSSVRNKDSRIKEEISKIKFLLVDQQISANTMRDTLVKQGFGRSQIQVVSWFTLDKDYKEEGDIHLTEEDQFQELVEEGNFDVIVGDPVLQKMLRNWKGRFVENKQFALSGKINE